MSDELLCGPCQRFLSGENHLLKRENRHLSFIHHETAESFQQGLALPCRICRRLRALFRRVQCIFNPIVTCLCKWLTCYRPAIYPSIRKRLRSGTDHVLLSRITSGGSYQGIPASSLRVFSHYNSLNVDSQRRRGAISSLPSGSLWCCIGRQKPCCRLHRQ